LRAAPPRRASGRKTLFWVHGIAGAKLGILMAMICLPGTLATVSHEIDWLLAPAIRVAPSTEPPRFGAIHDAVRAAHPEADIRSVHAPLGSRFAADVVVITPEGQWRHVYVDPVSAEVRGDTSYVNAQRFLLSFHAWLFELVVGHYLVTSLGLLLLVSLVTGIFVHRKFWRGFFRLRLGAGRRVAWGDLHKLLGVWSLAFAAVIALTGIWYLVEIALMDAGVPVYRDEPALAAEELSALGPAPRQLSLDAHVAAARAAYPGLDVRAIWLPATGADLVRVDGQDGTLLVRDRASRVYTNPFTAEVVRIQRAHELGAFYLYGLLPCRKRVSRVPRPGRLAYLYPASRTASGARMANPRAGSSTAGRPTLAWPR